MDTKNTNTQKYVLRKKFRKLKSNIWQATKGKNNNSQDGGPTSHKLMHRTAYGQSLFKGYSRKKYDHLQKEFVRYESQMISNAAYYGSYTIPNTYIGKNSWEQLEIRAYHNK